MIKINSEMTKMNDTKNPEITRDFISMYCQGQ